MERTGKDSEYRMLHLWVEKQLGKPEKCENCGTTEKRRYHWANISGEYKKDLSDWKRLCVPCHMRETYGYAPSKSIQGHCPEGHKMTPENTYTFPAGHKECRECRKLRHGSSNTRTNPRRFRSKTAKTNYIPL